MTTPDLEQLTRRLSLAEQEITRTRAEVGVLREHCQRLGRARAIASGFSLVAVAATVAALWSATTQAQGPAPPLTVRAPFNVVDAANNAIMTVQDSTTATSKDAKGEEKKGTTTNRGVHVKNGWGESVARLAILDDYGYVAVRQKGGQGGVQGSLLANKEGIHLALRSKDGTLAAVLSGEPEGLQFFNASGTAVSELNKTHFLISNDGGQGVVEAGMLTDGRGVVRAGPRFGGPPGGLNLPNFLVGKK
jgi:hypothetical protein